MSQTAAAKTFEDYPAVLSPLQVAELMGCTRRHVYDLLYEDKLRHTKLGGRWKIRKRDLEKMFKGGD